MSIEEIKNALNELLVVYEEMEKEYDIGLLREMNNVKQVLEDIPRSIYRAEHR